MVDPYFYHWRKRRLRKINNLPMLLVNPGAETGDLSGWTTIRGTPTVFTGPDGSGTLPYEGDFYFYAGSSSAHSSMEQDYPIDSKLHKAIDKNQITLELGHYASAHSGDRGCLAVTALNASGVAIGCYVQDYAALNNQPSWSFRSFDYKLPAGTRSVRVQTDVRRSTGASNDYHIDNITGLFKQDNSSNYSLPILQCTAIDGVDEWTVTSGQLISQGGDARTPRIGLRNFYAGSNALSEAYQDVAIPTDSSQSIDSGNASLNWEFWQYCIGTDKSRVGVRFLESDGVTEAGASIPAYTNFTSPNWTRVQNSAAIPPNTRIIRFLINFQRNDGTSSDAYTDSIRAEIEV